MEYNNMTNFSFLIISFLCLLTLVTFALLVKSYRKLSNLIVNQQTEFDNIKARIDDASMAAVNASYLTSNIFQFPVPLGGPSIDAHHARTILFLLQVKRPKRILELGSGSSTVYISHFMRKLKENPVVHVAIDHDARFLDLTRDLCILNGVEQGITFAHCPLGSMVGSATDWYQIPDDIKAKGPFDLIIVDGPPAYAGGFEMARYPAMGSLLSHLSQTGILILDDSNRSGEQAVLSRWKSEHPELVLEQRCEGKGHTLISRQPLF